MVILLPEERLAIVQLAHGLVHAVQSSCSNAHHACDHDILVNDALHRSMLFPLVLSSIRVNFPLAHLRWVVLAFLHAEAPTFAIFGIFACCGGETPKICCCE